MTGLVVGPSRAFKGAAACWNGRSLRGLEGLLRNAGKVLTHRQLLAEIWGAAYVEHSNYLRVYMAQLRQKLEADPAQPQHLLTEIGVGYRLAVAPLCGATASGGFVRVADGTDPFG